MIWKLYATTMALKIIRCLCFSMSYTTGRMGPNLRKVFSNSKTLLLTLNSCDVYYRFGIFKLTGIESSLNLIQTETIFLYIFVFIILTNLWNNFSLLVIL